MSVYLTRGDACLLPIYCKNSKGESYIFRNGETLRFRVFRKRQCKEVVLVKDITVFEDTDRVELYLSPNETRFTETINSPVEFWYEVELNHGTTAAQTIVGYDRNGPKILRIYPEGFDEEDEFLPTKPAIKTTEPICGYVIDPDTVRGSSAYEIAVKHGFQGSEEAWLESMQKQTRVNAEEVIHEADAAYEMLKEARDEAVAYIESLSEGAYSIVQTDGFDSACVMSQKAVTDSVGNAANAVKAVVSGTAVRFDDGSPLRYKVAVQPHGDALIYAYGKNLLSRNTITAPHDETVLFSEKIRGNFCLSYKNNLEGNINSNVGIFRCMVDGEEKWTTKGTPMPFRFSGTLTEIRVYNWNGATGGSIDDIQLELGTEQTEFEPYAGRRTAGISSTGGEIERFYPTMTVFPHMPSITVDVEYRKDMNKVVEKLTQAIVALGGKV